MRDQADSGDYNSASEVVREALRRLKRYEEQRQLRLRRLGQAIQEGDQAIANGGYTDLASDEELSEFFAAL